MGHRRRRDRYPEDEYRERQLSDGRAYLLGDRPEWAVIGTYFPLWMLAGHAPDAAALVDPLPRVAAWRTRLAAWGTGDRVEIDAEAALGIARAASPGAAADGADVSVWPVAHPEMAVAGGLASASADESVIHREDPRAGTVAVHFPAIGYRIGDA